jgi:hypothetical protein
MDIMDWYGPDGQRVKLGVNSCFLDTPVALWFWRGCSQSLSPGGADFGMGRGDLGGGEGALGVRVVYSLGVRSLTWRYGSCSVR